MDEPGLSRLRIALLALALSGFAAVILSTGSTVAKTASLLSQGDVGRRVLVFGAVLSASPRRLFLCHAGACVDALFSENLPENFLGRRVWVSGVYRGGIVSAHSAADVDVVG